MTWLLLDQNGAIERLSDVEPDPALERPGFALLECDVPPGYPETLCWDAANRSFAPNTEALWRALRTRRDALLAASDWTQVGDQPEARKLTWRPYRQALRDLPENTADPLSPNWPEPPTS